MYFVNPRVTKLVLRSSTCKNKNQGNRPKYRQGQKWPHLNTIVPFKSNIGQLHLSESMTILKYICHFQPSQITLGPRLRFVDYIDFWNSPRPTLEVTVTNRKVICKIVNAIGKIKSTLLLIPINEIHETSAQNKNKFRWLQNPQNQQNGKSNRVFNRLYWNTFKKYWQRTRVLVHFT